MDSDESTIIMGAEEEEEAPPPPPPPPQALLQEKLQELAEKAKFYTSLCLGTSAILAVFAFLFLIPFVVEPAIATIIADFEAEPVTCAVSEHVYAAGLRNCSWASCREGCTTAHTRCYQILVNYSLMPFSEYSHAMRLDEMSWHVTDTRFFVNTEGCGYPPRVNCTSFAAHYRQTMVAGVAFPCHYSKARPQLVVARYSWPATLRHLALALSAPPLAFAVAVAVLAYWHCACCQCRHHRQHQLLCDNVNLDEPIDANDTEALWKG